MENGKWWDSFTNILALIVVVAMVAFTAMRLLPIEIFSGAVTLILGAYFVKNGQKDGQRAAIDSQNAAATTPAVVPAVPVASPVDHTDDTLNKG